MKNTIEGFNSILDDAEEWISDMEDKVVEMTQSEQQKEKGILRNEVGIGDNIKH